MKTRSEVEALKKDWLFDGTWDLEDTEGFEEYSEELLTYREMKETEWEAEAHERTRRFARKLLLTENLELSKYIQQLEVRLSRAELEIDKLKSLI